LHDSQPVITVNQRGAARLRGGHVWVYRSDLMLPAEASPGALVQVRDERGKRLGSALYSSASQIAIRLLSSEEITEEALPDLLRARIASAIEFRRRTARDTDSYRVIFSEADLLPGLIVDKYNDVLAMQALTQAFDRDDLRRVCWARYPNIFPTPACWNAWMRTFASWRSCRRAIRNYCEVNGRAPSLR
jgi:23S rRNA (cytosine1962-C5)-methyltransferase